MRTTANYPCGSYPAFRFGSGRFTLLQSRLASIKKMDTAHRTDA